MRLTHTCPGPQSPCGLLIVALIGFLSYLPTKVCSEVESPKILHQNFTWRGDGAVFSCKADPGRPDDFTLIYWLVNRTFIEIAYSEGRIHETEERAVEENGRMLIQRDLIFKKVHEEDYRSSYTCIVTSPAGIDKRIFRLPRKNVVLQKFIHERLARRGRPRKTKKHCSRSRNVLKRSQSHF